MQQSIARSLKMGAFGKEESVLKLVHPGRFVEIHRRPVKASEVMQKNPRHCVTRPDVFKFPWIVVSPESILEPGNVFYIVPKHTIYRLLQAHESSIEPRKPKGSNPNNWICSTTKSIRTQPIDIPMDSREPQMAPLPQGSYPKKLCPEHTRSKWPNLRPPPSKPPSLKSQPPDPSLKSLPSGSQVKATRQCLKHRNFNDHNDDHSHGRSLVRQAKCRSIHEQINHEVSVAPNKQHDKGELKPCLIKEGGKRAKPQGLKVRFQSLNVRFQLPGVRR